MATSRRRPHWHPPTCKVCGARSDDGHHISQTGLCLVCAKSRFVANLEGMVTMSGPWAQHWRRAMAASVGAVLLDAPGSSTQT